MKINKSLSKFFYVKYKIDLRTFSFFLLNIFLVIVDKKYNSINLASTFLRSSKFLYPISLVRCVEISIQLKWYKKYYS